MVFFYKGAYIDWTINFAKIKSEGESFLKHWYEPHIPTPDNLISQKDEIKELIKAAFFAYEEIDLSKNNVVVNF